ncbi:uncharacterized protein [Halyomorpha halys]|uniref:uncharacterized protein n=1 Tax=Halyomorpha halys TaxID=286706 RepID=UPI0006D51B6D|nr:uncharacterized protein LOC106688383 [Halyomorpha halys]
MVSVNEKYFIEKLACENAAKSLSPPNLVSSEDSCSSDGNLIHQTSIVWEGYEFDDPQEDHSNFDLSWSSSSTESDPASSSVTRLDSSDCMTKENNSRKRIVWDHKMVKNINSILSQSDPNSYPSCSNNEKKKLNENFNHYHQEAEKIAENFSELPGHSICWDQWSTSPTKERDSPQAGNVKKRNYPKYDDQIVVKKFKVKKSLDPNWRYKDVLHDEIVSQVIARTIESEDWVRINRPKIFLLGDSHARYLADIIIEMLPGFKVEGSVKPGAKSKDVLSSIKNVLQDTGENDFVVTLSGTNDTFNDCLDEAKSVVYNAVMDARYTNLVVCNVPNNYFEYDNPSVQNQILDFNKFYRNIVNSSKWAHLVDLKKLKNRGFFTRHGMHFNLYGKIEICDLISHTILDIIDSKLTLKEHL